MLIEIKTFIKQVENNQTGVEIKYNIKLVQIAARLSTIISCKVWVLIEIFKFNLAKILIITLLRIHSVHFFNI